MVFRLLYFISLILFVILLISFIRWMLNRSNEITGDAAHERLVAIMSELYDGESGIHAQIEDQLQRGIDWQSVRRLSESYLQLAEEMPRLTPPRGDRRSWATQTSRFIESIAELTQFAESQDRDRFRQQFRLIRVSCSECHRSHRP